MSARPKSHQRRYRRAWLERRCGASYRQIAAALTRCGRTMRTTSDADIVRLVVQRLRQEQEERSSEADAIVELIIEIGRSRRWIVATLRRLDLSARDRPLEALRAARAQAEARARAARQRKRVRRNAPTVVQHVAAANSALAAAV